MVNKIPLPGSIHTGTGAGLCFFILMLVLLFSASAHAKDAIGEIKSIKGTATVLREGDPKPLEATKGMPLFLHDQLKSGPGSRLRLAFKDGSYMVMGEKANLHLDRFEFDTRKQERNAEFRVVVGKFKVFAKDLMKFKKRAFQVKTPHRRHRCSRNRLYGLGRGWKHHPGHLLRGYAGGGQSVRPVSIC